MKKFAILLTAIILVTTAAGCGISKTDDGRLNVVCTVFPQYDFVKNIAGDAVNLKMLLPLGSEAHSYEPTPQDITDVSNADILIMVGGESEAWAEHILESTDTSKMKILKMIDEVDAFEEEIVEGMDEKSVEHHGHHDENIEEEHEEYDEHVWTSPKNAVRITNSICRILCEADSKNSDTYRKNTASYILKLEKLDAEYKHISQTAKRETLIFGDRFPFRYLTENYGFKYFAAFPGCSSHTEPSPAAVIFLINKIKSEKIPVVFCVDYSDARIAHTISSETGAAAKRLYSCHIISKKQFKNGETYLSLMKKNAAAIKEALN